MQRQGYAETLEAGLQARRYLRLSNRALFIWVEPRHSPRNILTPNGHWKIPSFESPARLFSRLLSGKRAAVKTFGSIVPGESVSQTHQLIAHFVRVAPTDSMLNALVFNLQLRNKLAGQIWIIVFD